MGRPQGRAGGSPLQILTTESELADPGVGPHIASSRVSQNPLSLILNHFTFSRVQFGGAPYCLGPMICTNLHLADKLERG